MKFVSRLAGAVATAAVAATMLTAAPATAVPGDVTLTYAPTAVLMEGSCIDHAFTYNVELPPEGVSTWSLDTEIVGPDGEVATRQSVGAFNGSPTAGTEGWQLCSLFDPVGTYTIYTTVDYKATGASMTTWGTKKVSGTFQVVRNATSKVTLKAKRKGAKVTATAKVGVSTGGDYGPVVAGSKVTFQKKVGKKWKKVAKASTNASGVAKAKFKAKKGAVVRAVFAGAGKVLVGSGLPTPPATSKAVRIR